MQAQNLFIFPQTSHVLILKCMSPQQNALHDHWFPSSNKSFLSVIPMSKTPSEDSAPSRKPEPSGKPESLSHRDNVVTNKYGNIWLQ